MAVGTGTRVHVLRGMALARELMVGVSGFLAPLGDGMAMALVLPVPTCRYSLFRGSEAKTRAKLFYWQYW